MTSASSAAAIIAAASTRSTTRKLTTHVEIVAHRVMPRGLVGLAIEAKVVELVSDNVRAIS